MPQGNLAARSVGVVLAGLWSALAVAIALGYRPGGPVDQVVSLTSFVPWLIASAAVIWPPFDLDQRVSAAMVWLGILSALLVAPLLTGVIEVLAAGGRQTLLPSLETAYAAVAALATTCLYAALGVCRRWLPGASPVSRLRVAGPMAVGLALIGGTVFGTAALVNEQALRDRPLPRSAWGPTDPALEPPHCDEPLHIGPGARVDVSVTATIDFLHAASATISGLRQGSDEVWTGRREGRFGAGMMSWTRAGEQAWLTLGTGSPQPQEAGYFALRGTQGATLEGPLVAVIGDEGAFPVAEEVGLDLFDGATARHCRRAIDGTLAIDAVLALRWLASQPLTMPSDALEAWRGEIDWWVFADGQLGRAVVTVSGYPGDAWPVSGIGATLEATLSARDRDLLHTLPTGPSGA